MKIWTVDAFTTKPYAGNPAGVAIVDEFPADITCQRIAAEINLSETAFVKTKAENHFHIRWFTPAVEVKLCGHGTLASAHILYQEKLAHSDHLNFDSLSGPLRVFKNNGEITLDFPLQPTTAILDNKIFETILETPVIESKKALDDVIVELADETAIRNLQPDIEKIKTLDCRGLIITAQAKKPYDFISRFFAPRFGVLEDPVTGSAHCKLAHYWQTKLNKTDFFAYQASKHGGELKLKIQGERVFITGSAVTIMAGNWLPAL